jgi:hypothetical protein
MTHPMRPSTPPLYPWRPTHIIAVTRRGASVEFIHVMEHVDGWRDRPLYTEAEWNAYEPADWTIGDKGELRFQGFAPPFVSYEIAKYHGDFDPVVTGFGSMA